jgi:hypothetical protein
VKDRIARWAAGKPFIEDRSVFDVRTFLHLGSFFAADDGGDLVLRLSPQDHEEALQMPGAKPWRAGPPGRPVYAKIPAAAVAEDAALHAWLERALAFVSKLPPKERLLSKGVHVPEWKTGKGGGKH